MSERVNNECRYELSFVVNENINAVADLAQRGGRSDSGL